MTPDTPDVRTVPTESDPATDYPTAIAARIGDRALWLGNGEAVEPTNLATMELDPDYVVSVNRRATAATTDHHPLVDGRINDQAQFDAAAETARERHRQDGTILVNCAAGISRSATIVATVIAIEEKLPFERAVETVQAARPRAAPHRKLQINAYSYLARHTDRAAAYTALADLKEALYLRREDDDTAFDPLA